MGVATVQHGQVLGTFDDLTVNEGLTGVSVGTGSFTVTAAAVTTITDASSSATSRIVWSPANAAAGLLTQLKTCYVTTGAGSFTFNVSATGAGQPAGTELINYIILSES